MSNLWNRTANMFGMGSAKKRKNKVVPPAMPDTEELRKIARKKQATLAQRGGRVSTILDEDTLG